MGGFGSSLRELTRRRLPVVTGAVGLVVGVTATWVVAGLGAEEPNPIVNADGVDETVVRLAVDAWRARPAAERPRGEITVVHTASTGDRDVLLLLDETGLGSAYSRPDGSESGELRWVTTIGTPADEPERTPARLAARSLLVGPADVWVDKREPGTRLRAAVLTGDEVRWQPVKEAGGVALDVPEVGQNGCGLRIIAEQRDDSVIHAVWPERTPVGAQLRGDIRPLDPSGRRPTGEAARPRQADLDAAQLRLLSRLACVQAPETGEPRTAVWNVTELWRGELPGSGPASLFTLVTGDNDMLLLSTDRPRPGGSVLRQDVSGTRSRGAAAVASWFDRTDPAADGPYRHWIVVAGTEEVARIDVVLGNGRRVTGQGRYLAVDLEKFGIDGTTTYQVAATDHEGNPVTVL